MRDDQKHTVGSLLVGYWWVASIGEGSKEYIAWGDRLFVLEQGRPTMVDLQLSTCRCPIKEETTRPTSKPLRLRACWAM